MSDDTSLAADISAAMSGGGDTSTQSPTGVSATADTTASTGAATTQPADPAAATPTTHGVDPSKTGPIPFDVHTTAIKNARTKGAEEARAQWEQQYGWATQVTPQEFEQIRSMTRHFASGDVEAGLRSLGEQLRKDPAVEAQLRSYHARELARSRQVQPPAETQMVQVQLEDGTVVALPRDPQAWLAHQQQQWEAGLDQKLQPLRQTHEELQAARQAQAQQFAVDHFVSTTYADVQTWPGMDSAEARATVANALAQARIDPADPREVQIALNAAYRTHIVPTLTTASRQAALHDATLKAHVNTVSPSRQTTGAPKSEKDMSWQELFRSELAARK